MRKRLTYPVFLFLAVLLVFFQAAGFGLLGLDDADSTVGNAFVSTGLSWRNVREAFTNLSRNGIWMPVTNITYMADFTFAGAGGPVPLPFGYYGSPISCVRSGSYLPAFWRLTSYMPLANPSDMGKPA